ncbi:hypothetical protein PILCRDRAFT_4640 [Piloderma croceum F 1598]|uniref:Uncharacterized protein n=1 Tax=Piloderma croceum (strain F 1598) TaxID=765440 RepID=A0A0C3BK57_PILCF|nr:hypothetical protein PILCRDRAFT_4640 [Piloderma croceum F 1598]
MPDPNAGPSLMSRASFSTSVLASIRQEYGYHCSICLNILTQKASQCAHLVDSATIGLSDAICLGVLPVGYKRRSAKNGLVHMCYFTPNHIALSPPLPVLQYILDYLFNTEPADRKALHEVFDLLEDWQNGHQVELPDPTAILPYLGLFSLVVLTPEVLENHLLVTSHLPNLSVLENNRFIFAPDNISPTAPNVAQIYDVLAVINTNPPKRFGQIPLSPQDPEFQHRRYWRLPKMIGAILTVLIERVGHGNDGCAEIVAAQTIRNILSLSIQGIRVPKPSSGQSSGDGSGGGGGGSGDARPSGGGSGGNKSSDRKRQVTQPSRSATKKTRQATRDDTVEEDGSEFNGEGDSSDGSRSPPHGVHPDDWEVASSFSSLGDGPARMGSPCGTGFHSSSSNNTPPLPDGENPGDWQFGPSFSTNKIIFTARAVRLV